VTSNLRSFLSGWSFFLNPPSGVAALRDFACERNLEPHLSFFSRLFRARWVHVTCLAFCTSLYLPAPLFFYPVGLGTLGFSCHLFPCPPWVPGSWVRSTLAFAWGFYWQGPCNPSWSVVAPARALLLAVDPAGDPDGGFRAALAKEKLLSKCFFESPLDCPYSAAK